MENLIVTVMCIALLLSGTSAFAISTMNTMDALMDAFKDANISINDMRMTAISHVSSTTNDDGTEASLLIRNDGQLSLTYFNKWDIIVTYANGNVQWLPHGTQIPGWTVEGIYINGQPEIFEPNIFNTYETLKLNIKLSPPVTDNSTNLVNIVTPNGISALSIFGKN